MDGKYQVLSFIHMKILMKREIFVMLIFAFTIGSCIVAYLATIFINFKDILGENILLPFPFLIGGF